MPAAHARVSRRITVPQPRESVWRRVEDMDGIAGLMPSLERCTPLGDGQYHWQLRSYTALGYRFSPEVTLAVEWRRPDRISFTPTAASSQRATGGGALRLDAVDVTATEVSMEADVRIDLPVPRLLVGPAGAVLTREFRSGFDRFLARLADAAG